MSAHKVLVCGWREYKDQDKIYHVLDAQFAKIGDSMMLIVGGQRGADNIAREWAVDRKVDHLVLHAKWERFGKAAGPIRNRRMAKKKPRLVLAFHPDLRQSKGTKDMVWLSNSLKIKTRVFK